MEGIFDLYQGEKRIGSVEVRQQGLYCCFSCRCTPEGEDVYKLWVTCGEQKEGIGVLVPTDGGFGIEKRIPAKRLGEGTPAFHLIPSGQKFDEKFVPINQDGSFDSVDKLENAVLAHQDGAVGIVIQQPQQTQEDTLPQDE